MRLAFALFLALSSPLQAAERWDLPINESTWRNIKVPGVSQNKFIARDNTLRVKSDDSASFRYLKLPLSINRPEIVSWSWRVDEYSGLTTQTKAGRDDRPLAVHIWFEDNASGLLFGSLGSVFGYPKVGHLITYVWGADALPGSVLQNPHYAKGKLIVIVGKNGSTGEWSDVRRDIVKDYKRSFGISPDLSDLRYIAVSADSDDLNGRSIGAVRGLSLASRKRLADIDGAD
ncbi:MAG: DUF3047 domain-containing protein [Pseudomonadota bacterium]